ncbi:MAG: GatB/YqeY domain-containing protein [Epsilonproteobacteria bacterium]|nr:GatB/YqeY domain-containing protein [Campylobacterota bacterium]
MSDLKEKLKSDLKEAMKAKDVIKRDTIRFLMSALKQVEVDERKELSDEDIVKIIQKSAKQREDSMKQYKDAGRDDLYQKEQNELNILKSYLPKQLDDEEIRAVVSNVIQKTGATSMKDIGKVMGMAIKECGSRADGKRINAIVKELLS